MNARRLLFTFGLVAWLPATSQSQHKQREAHEVSATYLSVRGEQPPLPFNPFPELPTFSIGNRLFAYDDTEVDYDRLRAEAAAMKAESSASESPNVETMSTGMAAMTMSGDQLRLAIELTTDNGKRISFNTRPGFVYEVQESINLTDWTKLDVLVADDTSEAIYSFGEDNRFYRVLEGSDLIQFPNWFPAVHQSAHIDVYTPLRGTARVDIYADGQPWYAVEGGIPESGLFRVSDGLYNPNNWPYDGLYNKSVWEFRITITEEGPLVPAATHQGIVFKRGKNRNITHSGITVHQRDALGPVTPAVEEEVQEFMRLYFLANLTVGQQVSMSGSPLDEFTDGNAVPSFATPEERNTLRTRLFGESPYLDRFHYFGHGSGTSFGGIRISELRANVFCAHPYTYVALDGCRTSQTTDMLGEFTCYWKRMPLLDLRNEGLIPGFGCGWNQEKAVAFLNQGVLVHNHFYFWVDFYGFDGGLTHRFGGTGPLDRTYQEAYDFARAPMGNGIDQNLQTNPEAKGFVRVGCQDCFFDH